MPDTHARFSPSAANRRIHCPPSLLLEEQFEEGESVYAAEGTAGHALAEHLIRKHLKQRTTRPTSEYYKDELLEAVDEYVAFVIGEIEDARRECHSPVLLVEQRIDASEYVDGCFGTADMVIITDKVAHVIDLKLGKGVEVHAEENPQLMTSVRGLGNWTAKMYLMFVLGRPDVLPFEDGAFRQTYRWLYRTEKCSAEDIKARCKKWRPFSSTAARYFYQVLDRGYTKNEFHLYGQLHQEE